MLSCVVALILILILIIKGRGGGSGSFKAVCVVIINFALTHALGKVKVNKLTVTEVVRNVYYVVDGMNIGITA